MKAAATRNRHVHRARPGNDDFDRFKDRGLARNRAHQAVLGMAGEDVLIDGVFSLRERRKFDHVMLIDSDRMA